MKTIFTLIFLFSASFLAQAHPDDGAIGITNLSSQDIIVEVDGKQYTNFEKAVTIRDISPGFHVVRVYGENRRNQNGRPTLYSRQLHIRSKFFVDIVINRFGRVFTDEQQMNGRWRYDDNPGQQGMNAKYFLNFTQALGKESFDNSKMTMAKMVIDQNWFTSEQAKEVTRQFSFESNRLEIAQYLYGKTLDKENYFILNEVFDFSMTKDKLAGFIKNYK